MPEPNSYIHTTRVSLKESRGRLWVTHICITIAGMLTRLGIGMEGRDGASAILVLSGKSIFLKRL